MPIWDIFFLLASVLFLIALFLIKKGEVPHWLQDTSKPKDITREDNPKKFWWSVGGFMFFSVMFVFFGIRLI